MKRGKEGKRGSRKEKNTRGRERGKGKFSGERVKIRSPRDPQCGSDLANGETKNRRHVDSGGSN